jgi:RNA polymerase sigma factor (sigma-70 family)
MEFAAEFYTTHWSVVCLAGAAPSPEAEAALEKLCSSYWMPVYAFIRRRGHSAHDAEDLTQAFFSDLLSRRDLAGVDRSRGRFRSFLIACLNHFLAKDWRNRKTLKRGGGRSPVAIDSPEAEEYYVAELASNPDASAIFDRQWARVILDQALTALQAEHAAAGRQTLFHELRLFLTPATAETSYREAAQRLHLTPGAVATAVHRLRHRYRELVRAAVAQTVATPLELEEEMRHLMLVLSQ